MATPLLAVERLSKSFSGFHALQDVSLEVAERSIVGLVGPNGCGKSTLFNCVSGFLPFDSGQVRFRGEPVGGMAPHRIARLGLVRTFQNGHATKRMTVLENMLMAAAGQTGELPLQALFRRPAIRMQQTVELGRAREILETLKLTRVANEYAGNLSGGQQKLLALGRAVMCDADLIMLDEPAAGVNPTLVREFVSMVRDLRDRSAKTFLIIEHDMKFISGACDHVFVLSAGRNLSSGTPAQMQRDPRVLEVYLGKRHAAVA